MRLAVLHNLYFYNKLTERIRQALDAGRFAAFRAEYSENIGPRGSEESVNSAKRLVKILL